MPKGRAYGSHLTSYGRSGAGGRSSSRTTRSLCASSNDTHSSLTVEGPYEPESCSEVVRPRYARNVKKAKVDWPSMAKDDDKDDLNKKKTKDEDLSLDTDDASPTAPAPLFVVAPSNAKVQKSVLRAGQNSRKCLGFHVSAAGGVENAIYEALSTGCRAFGLFVGPQRTWKQRDIPQTNIDRFRDTCRDYGFNTKMILPHGSYLLNAGSPDPEVLQKTRIAMLHELKMCEQLGISNYNFHPGSTCGKISVEQCITLIAETLNHMHANTSFITTVIENMSCQGNTIGGRFEELKMIIDKVNDQSRIGICLDSCHVFAAGFDVSSKGGYELMMGDFDRIIGLQYLKAIHLNDSKKPCGSHVDRHENIGKGEIGLTGLANFMNDDRLDDTPMILETPECDYPAEMRLLYGLQK